jgi:hypothetical protein
MAKGSARCSPIPLPLPALVGDLPFGCCLVACRRKPAPVTAVDEPGVTVAASTTDRVVDPTDSAMVNQDAEILEIEARLAVAPYDSMQDGHQFVCRTPEVRWAACFALYRARALARVALPAGDSRYCAC